MPVLLALSSALAWGISDFLGGFISKRQGVWVTAFAVQSGGTVALAAYWLLAERQAPPMNGIGWAVLAGIAVGAGTGMLYRGLSRGTMGVVAPVSAVCAALLPVVVGLTLGERPDLWACIGIAAAVPAIWLVSGGSLGSSAGTSNGVVDAMWSGLGFGVAFVGLSRIPPEGVIASLIVVQLVAILPILVLARFAGEPSVPRDRSGWTVAWAGLFGAGANVTFVAATRGGELAVTSVLASMYPAITVVLAAIFLDERLRRSQQLGLAIAAVAVGLISLP